MNRKRIAALGKLGLLFGLPVALIFGLFSWGVYVGSSERVAITTFERDWLGLDVTVPVGDHKDGGNDDEGDKGDKGDSTADKADEDGDKADPGDGSIDEGHAAGGGRVADASAAGTTPAPTPANPTEPAAVATVADTSPGIDAAPGLTATGVIARVDPLNAALQARASMPITLEVKVLVDRALVGARTDWIDYVQRTVQQASAVYERQFGITLSLVSVGQWPVATDGMDATQLLDDLRTRPRESAEILVGLTTVGPTVVGGTERGPDAHVSGKADTPVDDNPTNGAYALVYATPGSSRPHLRTLMHELAHTLGAKDIVDRDAAGWLGKSFMSYAPVRDDEPAWVDPANRERILNRKDLPFAPEPPAPVEVTP